MSFKTMDDGQVLLYANSVNARYQTIPYPWLVFGEKVKVSAVFIRDSTGVSDSILILFGGTLSNGIQTGHLKMLDGYVDFFLDPNLADFYLKLKEELDKLIQKKLEDPNIDIHKEGKYLMLAVQELVSGDQCEGRFVFGHDSRKPKASNDENKFTKDGTNHQKPNSKGSAMITAASEIVKLNSSTLRYRRKKTSTIAIHLKQEEDSNAYSNLPSWKHDGVANDNSTVPAEISDFGLAKLLDTDDPASTVFGTLSYMCHEIFVDMPYGYKSEIWLLGCCMFETIAHQPAFRAPDNAEVINKISRSSISPLPIAYSSTLKQLIKSMLRKP
ncbi:hypothetical protein KIW84_051065 [Lathyrus oleraceus]|uniref:Protein kinase domain-containing protein n=1 Tax=Pisum sativum TaxID=3888 RepID=A0A9D5AA78_PEA|nr:hypothetical protein KIW84_051065 [Pisum sativum]